jgi:hypothetical protein
MDFSKKSASADVSPPPRPPADQLPDQKTKTMTSSRAISREFVFQRNLLVILIQNIRRNPAYGRRVVKFLQAACLDAGRGGRVQQAGGFNNGIRTAGGALNGSAGGSSSNNFSRSCGNNFSNSYGGNNGGFAGINGNGGGGGSLHSSRSSSTDNEDGGSLGGFDDDESGTAVDFDLDFEFAESATRKWIAENPELNPLKVLDHLQLRPDVSPPPPPNGGVSEVQKPPDLAAIDRDTATFLQLAVPVPDPTQTFLDIGTDFGPISMYEDDPFNLEQLVPSTFNLEPPQQQQQQQQQHPLHHHLYNESLQKPVGMGGLVSGPENLAKKYLDFGHSHQQQQQQQQLNNSSTVTAFRSQLLNAEEALPLTAHHLPQQQLLKTALGAEMRPSHHHILHGGQLLTTTQTKVQQQQLLEQQQQQMLSLDLSIKQEPPMSLLAPFQIKEEPLAPFPSTAALAEPKVCADILSPIFPSPPTPSKGSGGGGGRKRTVSCTEEEEDLSHLPSLQMRIQVLQQRVSILGA